MNTIIDFFSAAILLAGAVLFYCFGEEVLNILF